MKSKLEVIELETAQAALELELPDPTPEAAKAAIEANIIISSGTECLS